MTLIYKALVAAALLLTAAPVLAGQYELVKGKGVEVCEAYEKSLNSFQPNLPMVGGRPVSSNLGIDKPEWKSPEDGLAPNGVALAETFQNFSEFLWERDVNPVRYSRSERWPQWEGTPVQMKEAHKYYRSSRGQVLTWSPPLLAEFDIDNDGNPEHVYFQHPARSMIGDLFAVLVADYKTVDRKKTERILPHPPFKKLGLGMVRPVKKGDWGIAPSDVKVGNTLVEDAASDLHYDFFFFKGKTYFDQWWESHPDFKGKSDIDAGLLRVFEPSPQGTQEICTYRFIYK